jgi:sortase family protein
VKLEIRLRWCVAVELLAAGIGLASSGITTSHYALPPIPHPRPAVMDLESRPEGAPPSVTFSRSAPVSISVPALGISSRLGPARGLNPDGTINDAPLWGPTWSLPWWYDEGPSPGQAGSAVLLGHVDSAVGTGHLGVFFRLGDLEPGDQITVTLANGSLTNWAVVSTLIYNDREFPDSLVYGSTRRPTLRLVTCGGPFNWNTHRYESAVVVTASEVV